ncbi:MAG: hypothetical protein DRZ79_06120 [Candidatus Cloacimonadota bacterium]|nr:MAG: hypothetical protein DRZ79_06120 [Candidatus Cloacimonadota bacterium]
MKNIIREGKSTSEIVNSFMKEFNLKLEDFKFEVIEENSKGFFALFKRKRIKVKFSLPDISEEIKETIEQFLLKLEIVFQNIEIKSKGENIYSADIAGVKNAGFLIGKDAKLLDALQLLLTQIISRKEKRAVQIKLDVNNYRKRRKNALLDRVKKLAEQVKKRGKSITIEPLPAENRKLVHQFIEKDKTLKTSTVGNGDFKRIVISPITAKKNNNHGKRTHANKNRKH